MNSFQGITRVNVVPLRCSIHEPAYQATDASIRRAIFAAAEEREQVEQARDDYEVRRETALAALTLLCDEFGFPLVQVWLENVGRVQP